ncbi:loganic acid O-methyltransferase-like [Argentina anserina]|uniref:loganic acid O-methyltransferase-like n=1 Tax=Argentina anserina TaxID=57926 RepID=UPI00217653EB|nr:loganic acid O-methyltransferase-like [Potentilla anserina]XP_050379100.1 loganic acid O-methyltransferase-like [Potentilla anserina]XP_050379101.1 loganic acid O-methyltransferase-like [Potentilla anserina]
MAAAEETSKSSEAFPMKGGDGPNSYFKNSIYQRGAVDVAKQILNNEIAEKLDVEILLPSNTFSLADLGCSVGPNTFSAVDNILEAVRLKYQCQGLDSQIPEFQVFFNDHTLNDFNMLFKSLPPNRQYYAAGVPGSFHGRIFPNNSIHLFHSSSTNHWLSRVPKELVNKNCPAWNKGEIHYSNSTDEVVKAYEAQYAEDMECFLHTRSQEIVSGGLMVLIIPGRPNGTPHSKTLPNMMLQLLGTSLMEMARKGVVVEDKVDSFNIPAYYMSPQELEAAVERNGCFNIEKIENLPSPLGDGAAIGTRVLAYHMRAASEGLIKQQFGEEILDELFDLFCKKLEQKPSIFESGKGIYFLVVLMKRMPN